MDPDPVAAGAVGRTAPPPRRPVFWALLLLGGSLALAGFGTGAYLLVDRWLGRSAPTEIVRDTATVIAAVRDIARLETTELHVEKVIDLTDKQGSLFGLIQTEDAILLVAAGDVVVGIDFARLHNGDFVVDPITGEGRLTLPVPEILSTRLDEKHTFVYARKTGLFARRNEQLESRARQAALAAIEEAGHDGDVMARSKWRTEQAIVSLFGRLGIKRMGVVWRSAGEQP
jgi:hypothetical protein